MKEDKEMCEARTPSELLAYGAKRGWPLIPLCPPDHEGVSEQHRHTCRNPGKGSLITWKGRGVPTEDEAREWAERWGSCNVGLLLGGGTGYVRVDIDGEQGFELLDSLSGGDLPETWAYSTGSGMALLYRVPPGQKYSTFSQPVQGAGHQGLELLGDGHYTVLPPSVHANGKRYGWLSGQAPWELECAGLPQWALELMSRDKKQPPQLVKSLEHVDLAVTVKLSDKCQRLKEAIETQRGAGLQEPDWFHFAALLVRTLGVEAAQKFSRLSHKHNERSDTRIAQLAEEKGAAGPTLCKTLGCGADHIQECFGHGRTDADGELLAHPGWHLAARKGTESTGKSDTEVAWDAVRRVESGDFTAHLSDDALRVFVRVKGGNPAEFARMTERLKQTKVSTRNWYNAIKGFKEKQDWNGDGEKRQQYADLEEIGITVNPKTGGIMHLNANLFAAQVAAKFDLGIHIERESVYRYANGVWRPLWNLEFLRLVHDFLNELVPNSWTIKWEEDYHPALLREAEPLGELDARRELINLRNGMLDLDTMALIPHDKSFYSTIRVAIDFDPNATYERFLTFLEEIFDGDGERIAIVQEMFGYCLTAETKAHKAFFLYGAGGNGKSVLLDVLTALVGKENVSAVALAELANDFARSDLVGKTVNISTENESDSRGIDTAYFKKIVAGEPVRANVKYEKAFVFRPTAKMVFAINNLPYSRDRSAGFLRRPIVIPFLRQFLDGAANKGLTEELLTELPGMLNWALEGLRRLRANKYVFTRSAAAETAMDEFRANLSPVFGFVEECIRSAPQSSATHNDIHDSYVKWCELNGHKVSGSMTRRNFWKLFREALGERRIRFETGKSNGKDLEKGIRLLPEREWGDGNSLEEQAERLGHRTQSDWRKESKESPKPASGALKDLFNGDDEEEEGPTATGLTAKKVPDRAPSKAVPQPSTPTKNGAASPDCTLGSFRSAARVVRLSSRLRGQAVLLVEMRNAEAMADLAETYLYIAAKANGPELGLSEWREAWDGDLSRCLPLEARDMGGYQLVTPKRSA